MGDPNLHSIYKIGTIPCDTQMREILDPVDPDALRPTFKALFQQAQRGKALEPFRFLKCCYLVSLNGTEFYRSDKVGSKRALWVTIRSMFRLFLFDAMTDLLRTLVLGQRQRLPLVSDTS